MLIACSCQLHIVYASDLPDQINQLLDKKSFREAAELMVNECDRLVIIGHDIEHSDIDANTRDVLRVLVFRLNRLSDGSSRHAKLMADAQVRYIQFAEDIAYSYRSKPAVSAALYIERNLHDSRRLLEIFDKIPRAQRSSFNVDEIVFDELWRQKRFADVAETALANRIIARNRRPDGQSVDGKAVARIQARDLTIIARTILAARQVDNDAAKALQEEAAIIFTTERLEAAIKSASRTL